MKKLLFIFVIFNIGCQAQSVFTVVPLGVRGGSDECNLSAYAIAATGTEEFICLDAGTIHAGIRKAIENNVWEGEPADILKKNIKGYLISHPHLDHVSGLILNSPDDSRKPIYGTKSTLEVIRDNYFNPRSWINFGNEGEKPLNKYTYTLLTPGNEIALEQTSLHTTAFTLSHVNPNESTAFLIRNQNTYLLYLGDTGSDKIEKSDKLHLLWQAIGDLIKSKQLKAIFIEVSFASEQPDHLLFGHLTPTLLMDELGALSTYCGKEALKDFSVVITHIKPAGNREEVIKNQLAALNRLGVKLIFPEQGKILEF